MGNGATREPPPRPSSTLLERKVVNAHGRNDGMTAKDIVSSPLRAVCNPSDSQRHSAACHAQTRTQLGGVV
jgi:hypothetical protein